MTAKSIDFLMMILVNNLFKFKGAFKMERDMFIDEKSKVVNWDRLEVSAFKWMRFIAGTSATVWVLCQAIKGLFWLVGV